MAFDGDISDEEARERLEVEAREIVRHIRAGTVTYDTEDYATAAVMTLVTKREFQVMRGMALNIATFILDYPDDEEKWTQYLVADLGAMMAQLRQTFGEVEA